MSFICQHTPKAVEGLMRVRRGVSDPAKIRSRIFHDEESLRQFANSTEDVILNIFENQRFTYNYDPGITLVGETDEAENWGAEYLRIRDVWQKIGSGEGVLVGIADTGIDPEHPAVNAEKVSTFVEISSEGEITSNEMSDSQWHGTFCATILNGKERNGFLRGVAPECDLLVAKVFDQWGSSLLSIHKAFEVFIENDVRVASISLGYAGKQDAWLGIVNEFVDNGGIVVAGIGNDFTSFNPSISPGNYPTGLVIGVGAHSIDREVWPKSGGEVIDWQENGGATIKPDVVAPGFGIISSGTDGTFRIENGTSYATPHIAGLLACIWSKDLSQSNEQVVDTLRSCIVDAGSIGPDTRFGQGYVDISKLIS